MRVNFAPRGIVEIDDAEFLWPNFAGRGGVYNREGDRYFNLRIRDEEIAQALIDAGFNVKIREGREPGEAPLMYMKVNVKFHPKGSDLERLNPVVHLISGPNRNVLDADSICILDDMDILKVDLDLSSSNWTVNGKSGRSAYLKKMYVTQEVDRLAARYAEEEYPEDDMPPFA
jgi:hypothetical protein